MNWYWPLLISVAPFERMSGPFSPLLPMRPLHLEVAVFISVRVGSDRNSYPRSSMSDPEAASVGGLVFVGSIGAANDLSFAHSPIFRVIIVREATGGLILVDQLEAAFEKL
jgi:hypothetical protein